MARPNGRRSSAAPRTKALKPVSKRPTTRRAGSLAKQLDRLCRAGVASDVAAFVEESWRPVVERLALQHRKSLYAALEATYRLGFGLKAMKCKARAEVLNKLGAKAGGNQYLAILKCLWPPPPGGDQRRIMQNGLSRYAKVLNLAVKRGVKPDALAATLEAKGGIDGFQGIRRHAKPKTSPSPRSAKRRPKLKVITSKSEPMRGSFRADPKSRLYELRASKKVKKSLSNEDGLQLAILKSCAARSRTKIVDLQHLHVDPNVDIDALLYDLIRVAIQKSK